MSETLPGEMPPQESKETEKDEIILKLTKKELEKLFIGMKDGLTYFRKYGGYGDNEQAYPELIDKLGKLLDENK